MGGHLSPEGRRLLPDRKTAPALPPALWWIELATHCSSTWEYMEVAAGHLGYLDQLQAAGAAEGVPEATVKWRAEDRLRELLLRSLPRA
jgi:hypothetical protein